MEFITTALSVLMVIVTVFSIMYLIIRIALYYTDKCNTMTKDNHSSYNNGYDEYDIFN